MNNATRNDGGKWEGNKWAGTYEEWEKYWEQQAAKMPTQLSEEEKECLRETEWAVNDPEVQEKYPDMFVAVYRRQIVAAGENRLEVMAEAERITGLPPGKIAVTLIIGPGTLFAGH